MASIGDIFKNIGNGLKNGFNTVVKAVSSGFPTVLESVVSGAKSGGIVGAIGGVVSGITGAISNVKAETTSAVAVAPVPSVNVASSAISRVMDNAKNIVQGAKSAVAVAASSGDTSYRVVTAFIGSGGLVS